MADHCEFFVAGSTANVLLTGNFAIKPACKNRRIFFTYGAAGNGGERAWTTQAITKSLKCLGNKIGLYCLLPLA